ncbi:hypothetical protein XENTR_v10015732 [Xenopus tropicalis]|nr:hypothetical protein XENTR_v10015732 [Xenopus tropicalis]
MRFFVCKMVILILSACLLHNIHIRWPKSWTAKGAERQNFYFFFKYMNYICIFVSRQEGCVIFYFQGFPILHEGLILKLPPIMDQT